MSISHHIVAERAGESVVVRGYQCNDGCVSSISYIARCPVCGKRAMPKLFGPAGSLWSKTTLRIPAGDYPANRPVGYIDLRDGPRIACELSDGNIPIGADVVLQHINSAGDPVAEIS